jgi:ankyrin repeat protein
MNASIDQMKEKIENAAKRKLKRELEKRLINIINSTNAPSIEEVKALIESGASPKTKAKELDSCALTVAVINGHIEVAKTLIESGANPNGEKNHWGYTPLFFARKANNKEIIDLLIESGAKE